MICFFIDYLVLKTGWSDQEVLDNSHASNKRKFNTYRAMDSLEAASPIVAYPILSKEAGEDVGKSVSAAHEDFMNQIGFEKKVEPEITPAQEDQMREILSKAAGGPMVDIEDILKGRSNG